jgi:cysteine desulfurase
MRIGNTIYLDHHASTPVDSRVLAAMVPYFHESFANPHSGDHALGWAASRVVEEAARDVAALVGGETDEVIFTSGATEANNLALWGPADAGLEAGRTTVLVGMIDHKSAIATARAISRLGLKHELIAVDSAGFLDLDDLRRKLTSDVLVVSTGVVNSEIGTIQPVASFSEMAHAAGALVHCDAAQAPCALDISTLATHADLISLSGHKMYGPKGIGALYVRRDIQRMLKPIIHGGGQQLGLRSGTLPTPLCVGMSAAARLLQGEAASTERARVGRLRDEFIRSLQRSWHIEVNGPPGAARHPGNANLRFVGFSAHDLLASLQPKLAASIGSACSSGIQEPSHVLRGIGLTSSEAGSSVRFCVGRDTTDEDIAMATETISDALGNLANAGLLEHAG